MTHLAHLTLRLGLAAALIGPLFAQDSDFQVFTDSPRLLLNQRRLRLLKRERERESMRWLAFDAFIQGKARMSEPGFTLALHSTVAGQPGACRQAAEWAAKAPATDPADLRQLALVYDWCQSQAGDTLSALIARRLAASLKDRPSQPAAVRSRLFAALAIADADPAAAQDFLKFTVESWWRRDITPQLKAGRNPFSARHDLYALIEILHVLRDNLRLDLREGLGQWFDELAPLQILSYYPQPWPAAENEYRIPAYSANTDPDLRQAALSRAAELAFVAFDANAQPLQFLQGWLLMDRFLMRGEFGIAYEFLWANPYQPGLSFTYMPDLFHARGQLLARSSWDEDASWFGFSDGHAQAFLNGRRLSIRLDAKPGPVTLGPVKIFFASAGTRFDSGWQPPPEEGARPVEEVAFVLGLAPNALYDVEVDDEEMFEARSDSGGIVELRFPPGRKAGVRLRPATPAIPR